VADTNKPLSDLPDHIQETVASIARFHAEHHGSATPLERALEKLTALLGNPRAILALTFAAVGWIGFNLALAALGRHPPDPPPFLWMTGAISLAALYVALLILATQRRENRLAQLREQLALQLEMLNERKTAKIIELLEETRRDTPFLQDRVDLQAQAMSEPADPQSVLAAIRETHAEAGKE
jgi:uncharacterized membrane protein